MLDEEKKHLVQFRKSMKKFSTTSNISFSVVGHAQPYSFARLNNDIIVLLSSLGITNEKLLEKQNKYLEWIVAASQDVTQAIDFLSCLGEFPIAERVLLQGLDDPHISASIRRLQLREVAGFRRENSNKIRSRMMIHKSRLLFGVCDPFKVLKEGEVVRHLYLGRFISTNLLMNQHIRITAARGGVTTPIHGDVLVVRNPCLYPGRLPEHLGRVNSHLIVLGDCLKLRAVHNSRLSHLVDCIVFASVAKPGHHSAPAMSSGGDLDGIYFAPDTHTV
jgi:regulator of nonsense transcripts 1